MFFIVLRKYWKNHILELLLCWYLRHKRSPKDFITQIDLDNIKHIDSGAFPEKLQMFNDCETVQDLVSSCDCIGIEQIYFLQKNNWYIIATRHPGFITIKSFAAYSGRCKELTTVVSWLFKNFKYDKVKVIARESTSYQILLSFCKRNKIVLLRDKRIVLENEFFHDIILKAINKCN